MLASTPDTDLESHPIPLAIPDSAKRQHALVALIQRAGHPIQHLVYGQAQPLKINSIHHQMDVAASTSAAYVRLGPFIRQLNGYALDDEFLSVRHRYSSLLLGPANRFDAIVAATNRGGESRPQWSTDQMD
jgi:hypothetical protein